jgi:hypothetical protein
MYGSGDLDAIDRVDIAAFLRERWEAVGGNPAATDPFTTLPGLADGATAPIGPADPFASPAADAEEPARLLLVPCNRPAQRDHRAGRSGRHGRRAGHLRCPALVGAAVWRRSDRSHPRRCHARGRRAPDDP